MSETTVGISPKNGISHVSGDNAIAMREQTITQMFTQTVDRFADREAAVFCEQNIRWTWQQLSDEADALSAGLMALGLVKGDRIGIWSPNRSEWLLAQIATAKLGLILVNINPAYRLGELEYALNKVSCQALITAERFKTSDYIGMLQTLAPELADCPAGQLQADKLPALRQIIKTGAEPQPGMLNFDEVLESGRRTSKEQIDLVSAALSPDDAINIQFTSGTTGLPKGATLSHRNIVNNAHFVTRAMRFSENDRLCIPVPLYHCFGMVMGTLGCISKGAAMIFPGEGFEPAATLRAVSEQKCTALYGVPTMFVAELDLADFDQYDLSQLRTGIMAGAPCPIEVMKRVQARMNMSEVTIAYGMTETSPVSFQSGVDDPLEKRVTSVGRVHPHVEVKIVDDKGLVVPVGTQGELCTRGYSVMRGYWGDQSQTDDAIDAGGWMHTGDLATLDSDGYCNITGRVKDMIVRGGENVYPREVEEYLYRIEQVSQVQVFGIPDAKYGEVVCAWIVQADGANMIDQDVAEFCAKNIAHFKTPKHVRFVAEIPMTVTGKPQKFLMRKAMIDELGISEIESA